MSKEIRAQIDTELVKGLLLVNGGGVVALLAFLPTIFTKPDFKILVYCALTSILIFIVGIVFAIVHNRFRRLCSLEFDANWNQGRQPPPCNKGLMSWPKIAKLFNHDPPCICRWNVFYMWMSLAMFLLAGMVVAIGGFFTI